MTTLGHRCTTRSWVRDRPDPAIFLQPLQFLAHFDLAVPGIFGQRMILPRENKQLAGNAKVKEGMVEQVGLSNGHPNVLTANDDVGRCADLVDLKKPRFSSLALAGPP